MTKVLMVCLGNICRSPMAEGVLQQKASEAGLDLEVDSAGTSGWHAGEKPDRRGMATMREHGIDISQQRSRPFEVSDFDDFDLIYVMDQQNQADVLAMARNEADRQKVKCILDELYPGEKMNVPDPYYGGDDGFEHVYQLLDGACSKVVTNLTR